MFPKTGSEKILFDFTSFPFKVLFHKFYLLVYKLIKNGSQAAILHVQRTVQKLVKRHHFRSLQRSSPCGALRTSKCSCLLRGFYLAIMCYCKMNWHASAFF